MLSTHSPWASGLYITRYRQYDPTLCALAHGHVRDLVVASAEVMMARTWQQRKSNLKTLAVLEHRICGTFLICITSEFFFFFFASFYEYIQKYSTCAIFKSQHVHYYRLPISKRYYSSLYVELFLCGTSISFVRVCVYQTLTSTTLIESILRMCGTNYHSFARSNVITTTLYLTLVASTFN